MTSPPEQMPLFELRPRLVLGWLAAEACLGILVYGLVLRILAPSTVQELVQAVHSLRPRTPASRVAAE